MAGWLLAFCVAGFGNTAVSCSSTGPFVSAEACEIARKALEKRLAGTGICLAQDPKAQPSPAPAPKGG